MNTPLVSIIMPARNAEPYIAQAIDSVLAQRWPKWELLVVDNASTDATGAIARSFSDARISVHYEPQVGISNARNCALQHIRGEFFTFLDADDRYTPDSIGMRVRLLQSIQAAEFADGWVEYWNENFTRLRSVSKPSFTGVPYMEVAALNEHCLPAFSWMIKRVPGKVYHFAQQWTHSEDIAFLLSISRTGEYHFVDAPTLQVRRGHASTITDLGGLEKSYHLLLDHVETLEGIDDAHMMTLRRKVRSIMTKSYLKEGRLLSGILAWQKFSRHI